MRRTLQLIYFFESFRKYRILHNYAMPQVMPHAVPQLMPPFTLTGHIQYFNVWPDSIYARR